MGAIPLKTDLLAPGDDILEVARRALEMAGETPGPDDVLVICESPLAITQGRIVEIDDVRPGILARIFCRFFDIDSSLSHPYAVQVAMNEAGTARFVAAALLALPGRALGRRGDFYRLAGRQVAWMDDICGTMPPYTQSIILGPADPGGVCRRVSEAVGCAVAVVDANDLGRVDIMAASPGADRARLTELLRSNPQGNDDEQTPLVLVRAR